ncbi:MAG: hypothetical protein ABIZ05_01655 [Pseudonocardiaceae bacterium]
MSGNTVLKTYLFADLESLEDLFQNAPVGFLLTDSAGVPVTYNRAFALLTNLPWPERLSALEFRLLAADGGGSVNVPAMVAAETPVTDLAVSVDGSARTLLVNASAQMDGGRLAGVRWVVRPDLRQAIPSVDDDPTEYLLPTAELIGENDALAWAARLSDSTDVRPTVRSFTTEEAVRRQRELDNFIMYAPAAVHLIDVRGTVLSANATDLAVAGFVDEPDQFIGGDIRRVYAEQAVLEDLLGRWDSDLPTLNFRARLVNRTGAVLPVVIFSNSRFVDGEFRNTRDVVFVDPDLDTPPTRTRRFHWPHD